MDNITILYLQSSDHEIHYINKEASLLSEILSNVIIEFDDDMNTNGKIVV